MRTLLLTLTLAMGLTSTSFAEQSPIRVGIIGLDTSHAIAFAKEFNRTPANPDMQGCRVVMAYPHGSSKIESSYSRIPKYTEEIKELDVEIADSIEELLESVDCVLLETNDGTLHLEQSLEVFRAGKPVFIDKPLGANLAEAVAIVRAAEHFDVPMFSSSSLRYMKMAQAVRAGEHGTLTGCETYSPSSTEPSHTDLFWYGIHGVEILYTCMGTGCEAVSHTATKKTEVALGRWADGRVGVFRGLSSGKRGYGGTVFTDKEIVQLGSYEGYKPLLLQIAEFFRSKKTPIEAAETLELYAFMQAAYASKQQDGAFVKIEDVMKQAEQEAKKLLAGALDDK